MQVFILGATGYIGSAIASQLRAAGHSVVGLARTETSAEALRARGDAAVLGDLLDLEVVGLAASEADAVIDTAIAKDWELTTEVLTAAVTTVTDALPEGAPFILTTGAGLYGATSGGIVTEDAPRFPPPMLAHLPAVEEVVLGADRVRSITLEEAGQALGPAAGMLAMSADISNERAHQLLGWQPREVGLLEDLTTGSYRAT